jgi:hypothetical protein
MDASTPPGVNTHHHDTGLFKEGAMMLPFRRRPTPKPTIDKPAPEATVPPPDVTELHLRHVDYNLQPLSVESLSHYIEPVVDDERFRVH